MPSKKKDSQTDLALKALQGKSPPASVIRDVLTAVHARQDAQLLKSSATQRQMAKHLDRATKVPRIDNRNPAVARSLDAMLALHKKFSKQKLAAPKVNIDAGGLFPGRISVSQVAPFDFDQVFFSDGTGSNVAAHTASATRSNGQIQLSAISAATGEGGGGATGVVGLYFHPFGAGTLTVRAAPKFSFQWWTNSIRPTARVKSFGSISLNVFGVDAYGDFTGEIGTLVSNQSTVLHLWDEEETSQVRFDFKSDQQKSGSVSLSANHSLVYFMYVQGTVGVQSVGWPGSLAGAQLSVTVPSISYDYELQPVLTS